MEPIRIFISYAHANEIWLRKTVQDRAGREELNPKDLLTYWRNGLQFECEVEFWYDREQDEGLRGGDLWEKRIFEEIDRADVGVLLITQHFVQSGFIRRKELPRMVARAENGEMELVPVLVEPADWEELELASFQLTPGRPTPLSQFLAEHEHHYMTAMLEVLKALKGKVRRVRKRRDGALKRSPSREPLPGPDSAVMPAPSKGTKVAADAPQSRPHRPSPSPAKIPFDDALSGPIRPSRCEPIRDVPSGWDRRTQAPPIESGSSGTPPSPGHTGERVDADACDGSFQPALLGSPVDCSVFAPRRIARAQMILIQVFLHRPEQRDRAAAEAREVDEDAERRATDSLLKEIPVGSLMCLHLTMIRLKVHDAVQQLRWRGEPTAAQFSAEAPADCLLGTDIGTVMLSVEGVPVGHVKFRLTVVEASAAVDADKPVSVGEQVTRYRRAFVSYTSRDRNEVLARVQMLRLFHIEFFKDVLDLEPGDRWEKRLYQEIDRCDLFLLFWSSAAKASPWVQKELRYALDRKRGDDAAPPEIRPVILEGPPVVPPPPELAHMHFDDHLAYFRTAVPRIGTVRIMQEVSSPAHQTTFITSPPLVPRLGQILIKQSQESGPMERASGIKPAGMEPSIGTIRIRPTEQ